MTTLSTEFPHNFVIVNKSHEKKKPTQKLCSISQNFPKTPVLLLLGAVSKGYIILYLVLWQPCKSRKQGKMIFWITELNDTEKQHAVYHTGDREYKIVCFSLFMEFCYRNKILKL